ncbi:hypothetical protein [Candidatus Enterococcus ferrettii]|uniref:YcxB-like protein domain-containing protein n=1 Tax=Candidatus Enterococcus ferrettii TaxID=2815324 RepID=A0ABV0EY33_9ENTE|nr:hypothetical protein [Enterococcus sp. 665A]MBO1341255.1 hypothetical protein [Enterococcus sp. 665A]
MIEVLSCLTKEEWMCFIESYVKYCSKRRQQLVLLRAAMVFQLLLYSSFSLFRGLYFILSQARYPWSFAYLSMVMQIYTDKIFITLIFLVFFLYYLYRIYVLFSPSYIKKKMDKFFNQEDFQECQVQLTDEFVSAYSDSIDLRLNWKWIIKVFNTNELIVLFWTDSQCIVISKLMISEEILERINTKIDTCFLGSVINL